MATKYLKNIEGDCSKSTNGKHCIKEGVSFKNTTPPSKFRDMKGMDRFDFKAKACIYCREIVSIPKVAKKVAAGWGI
jgi:hypothetical protein